MQLKIRLKRALKRSRYAAMGAAIGGAAGGLFSRSAASTGAGAGALIGAVIAEKRYTPGGVLSKENSLDSDGSAESPPQRMIERAKVKKENLRGEQ